MRSIRYFVGQGTEDSWVLTLVLGKPPELFGNQTAILWAQPSGVIAPPLRGRCQVAAVNRLIHCAENVLAATELNGARYEAVHATTPAADRARANLGGTQQRQGLI